MKKIGLVLALVSCCSFGAINKYWHVKSDGTGTSAQGASWAEAINEDTLEKVLETIVVAGDVFFVMDGSYDFSASAVDFNTRDGAAISPIVFMGVKGTTTHEDSAVVVSDFVPKWYSDSTTMPTWSFGNNAFRLSDYCHVIGVRIYGAGSPAVYPGARNTYFNCCVFGTYGSSSSRNLMSSAEVEIYVIGCYLTSANTKGLSIGDAGYVTRTLFKNIDDATNGIACVLGARSFATNSVFNNCGTGLSIGNVSGVRTENLSFWNCQTDVTAGSAYSFVAINNIHDSTKVDGYKWTTQTDANFFYANHGDDARCNDMFDGVDAATVFQDYGISTGNPLFVNPAADSFQLGAGSSCINTGLGVK